MKNTYPILTSPIRVGRVTFRNRMFASPIGATDISKDGCIGERGKCFYDLRAKGGAAAVTVSELTVDPSTDASEMLKLNTKTEASLSSQTFTADAIRRHGAVPSIELAHSGMYSGTYMADKEKQASLKQYGPSEMVRFDGCHVEALTKEQIHNIVKAFGEAAGLAKRVGYEMVMVHGGHSWLLNQFLSPYFNKRTDEYGGSLENRVRLSREVLAEIRNAVGPGFPIEFRMSGSELFDGGYDLEEGCRIAHAVEDLCDIIHVSAGSYQHGFFKTHPSMFDEHGMNVYLAAEIKKHVSIPVATIGAINDPAMMEEILESGKADIIYMGRELIADPYLPSKICAGQEDDIVYCLRCFACMAERPMTFTRCCSVNPLIGREIDGVEVAPALKKKKVIVAGAGPAGLEAAITAAKRGHEVILCEKESEVGGILKSEQAIPFKHEMYKLSLTLKKLALDSGVELRLNTKVTAEYVENEKADALILAVGSTPLILPFKGMDGDNVITVNEYYLKKDQVKDKVVVLGGGLAGCECAVHLAQEGKEVHLVEMRDILAPDCNIRHRPILMQKIAELVTVHTEHTAQEVSKEGVWCKNKDGEHVLIAGDTVISASGQRPNRADAEAMHTAAPFVREVGDCIRPANIKKAIYEGYHAALDI